MCILKEVFLLNFHKNNETLEWSESRDEWPDSGGFSNWSLLDCGLGQ